METKKRKRSESGELIKLQGEENTIDNDKDFIEDGYSKLLAEFEQYDEMKKEEEYLNSQPVRNTKKTYSEKLQDPRWQKKRLLIMQRDGFKCTKCGDTKTTLHVHHKRYTHEDPWKHLNSDLTTLCANCHKNEHYVIEMREEGILKVSDFVAKYPEVTKLFTCIENHEGTWTLTIHEKANFSYPFYVMSPYMEKVLKAIDSLVDWLDAHGGFDIHIYIKKGGIHGSEVYDSRYGRQPGKGPVNFYDVVKNWN